jgi:hypothetical protein
LSMRGGAALPETEQRASGRRRGAENRRCRVVVEPGDGVGDILDDDEEEHS